MADSFSTEEDDTIRIYGSMNNSIGVSVPKVRAVTMSENDEAAATLELVEGRDINSLSNQIPESSHSDPQGQEDTRELLSPVDNREREDSPDQWVNGDEDDISIAPKSHPNVPCWQHPKIKKNWRIVLGSVILFVTGIILLCVGIVVQITHSTKVHSFVFFLAGFICLIPGAYHVVYIYCAVKGKKGYHFSHLPMFK